MRVHTNAVDDEVVVCSLSLLHLACVVIIPGPTYLPYTLPLHQPSECCDQRHASVSHSCRFIPIVSVGGHTSQVAHHSTAPFSLPAAAMSVMIRLPRAPTGFAGPENETLGSIARQFHINLPTSYSTALLRLVLTPHLSHFLSCPSAQPSPVSAVKRLVEPTPQQCWASDDRSP